jgi:hypothetical protein
MIILTKEWYDTIWSSVKNIATSFAKIPKTISLEEFSINLKQTRLDSIINFIIRLLAIIITLTYAFPKVLDILKNLFI